LEKDPAMRPSARELLDLLVTGPQRPAATAAALAHQPGLRAAAREAQAATGYDSKRQLTAVAVPPDLVDFVEPTDTTQIIPGVPNEGVPKEPEAAPRRRWSRPVVAALAVLAVLAAGALVVSSRFWGGSSGDGLAPQAIGSVSAAGRLLIDDALDKPWFWDASKDDKEQASCAFEGGSLVARRAAKEGSFRCRGPVDVEPDDLRIDVNVRLLSAGSCAGIWFRFRPFVAYQLRVCQNKFLVGTHKDAEALVIQTFPLQTPVAIGGPATKVTLIVRGNTVEVLRDNVSMGTVPLADPDITSGRVVLGIFTEPQGPGHAPPYAVAFDHITVRALP
jgi:hypothetical protein